MKFGEIFLEKKRHKLKKNNLFLFAYLYSLLDGTVSNDLAFVYLGLGNV